MEKKKKTRCGKVGRLTLNITKVAECLHKKTCMKNTYLKVENSSLKVYKKGKKIKVYKGRGGKMWNIFHELIEIHSK